MEEDYEVDEVRLSDKEIDEWIKRLKEIKQGKEHHHLQHEKGEVLVHQKRSDPDSE